LKYTGERLTTNLSILNPLRVENLARFSFFIDHFNGNRVLDLGCGSGEGTHEIATKLKEPVYAVDLSLPALTEASNEWNNPFVKFIQMDVCRLGFPDNTFDGLISIEVIEHIEKTNDYLAEAYRVLKPGGLIMLTTPNKLLSSPKPGMLWPEHVREYTPDEFSSLLHGHFTQCSLWAEYIPIYESNLIRKFIRKISPYVKPYLPHYLRVRGLPYLQSIIKSDIRKENIVFTQEKISECPTLIGLCWK